MTRMAWLGVAASLLGALVLAVVIWVAGPLIGVGDVRPFEGALVRASIILILFLVVGGLVAWRIVARRRAQAKIEAAMTETAAPKGVDDDTPVLNEKMRDALATLKNAKLGGANALYDLPWYLIIGPPGAGKTTALVNSGLKFPLAGDGAVRAVQGVGGTRYCDWWFTDQAVLIDTAGRYTTQDSDAAADRQSWLSFLKLLGANRPKQPINGVLVAISVQDVMNMSPAEVNAHADAIRKRLSELQEELKIDFPVYALFTKMDLVSGFLQYFADLDEVKRGAVWGATFPGGDRKANYVTKVPEEIDLLIQRLTERMPERLQDEPDLRARAQLFGFPAQIGAIRKPVSDFLARIFEPTRYQTSAALRGFYFTSGTQEGTPFDAVIGALQKSYGVESLGASAFSGVGKSFFLHDLLADVVFGEAGWVSKNIAAVRRAFALRMAAFALIALATAGIVGLWWMSYSRNRALIADTEQGVDAYAKAAEPLVKENNVADPDVRPVYELIDGLPKLPEGYLHRAESTPTGETFGLSQRDRLQDSSIGIYRDALERLYRPRLVLGLEQQLQKNIADPVYVYEALKVYLMLGGKAPSVDRGLIVNWFQQDWEQRQFPGAPYAEGRALLKAHLEAMLDLGAGETPRVQLNGPLVEQAQATLARMAVATRAYTLLKTEAHNEPISDWVASQHGGQDLGLVFQAANGSSLDSVRVPAFFTYAGFYKALLGHMTSIAAQLEKENWVLGPAGEQAAVKTQYEGLFPSIIDLYGKDFLDAWNVALGNLQLKPLLADKPKYLALSAASAPTSPIKLLFESVRDETALTRDRKLPGDAAKAAATDEAGKQAEAKGLNAAESVLGTSAREVVEAALKAQRRAGDAPAETPGASIENNFKPFQLLLEGDPGSRPIDALLANLNELYKQLTLAATNPTQAEAARGQADVEVASLRSNVSRLPQPLAGMMDKVVKDAASDVQAANIADLAGSMASEVTGPCQKIVTGNYPFVAGSDKDTPLADFARVFAPNGIIDKFFNTSVAPLVNTTGKTWVWKPNPNLPKKLSDKTLAAFQTASEIRDAFFPTGGGLPNLTFEVKPTSLSPDAQSAVLTVNGTAIPATSGQPPQAVNLQWPGAGAGAASIAFLPDLPDRKSTLDRSGPWALFRLVDKSGPTPHGNVVSVNFVAGGRFAAYQFTSATAVNPLSMPSLHSFQCPNGL